MTLAIQTLLDAAIAAIPGIPVVQTENSIYNTSGPVNPWVRTTLLPAESVAITIGYNASRQMQGLYQVDCFYQQNQGTTDGRTMADAIVAAFPIGTLLNDGTTKVWIDMASVMPARPGGAKGYVNYPVQIRWRVFK